MSKVILIVDDEQEVRSVIRSRLQASGYTTIEAADGRQGVELVKTRKPDLVLMDIRMPVMDGYAALHIIKADETTRNIPVVMLTAVVNELHEKATKGIGADGYVTKPFTPEKLLDAIGQFLPTS